MEFITEDFLKSEIIPNGIKMTRINRKLIHCSIETKDGFVFTGESFCANPAGFNQVIGEETAYKNAFNKMWEPYNLWLSKVNHNRNKPNLSEVSDENNS